MADIRRFFEDRRSVRKYKTAPVSDDALKEIVWAAAQAPTARNIQPWEFVVVRDPSRLQQLARFVSPNGAFLSGAAACIVIFCHDTKYYLEDGSAATTQALMAASLLGLGSCWIAGDKKEYAEQVRLFLGASGSKKLISLIALGVADEAPRGSKKSFDEMIHWEKF